MRSAQRAQTHGSVNIVTLPQSHQAQQPAAAYLPPLSVDQCYAARLLPSANAKGQRPEYEPGVLKSPSLKPEHTYGACAQLHIMRNALSTASSTLLLNRYLPLCYDTGAHKQRTTPPHIALRPLMPGSTHPGMGRGGTHAGRSGAGAHPAHAPHAVPYVLWVCPVKQTDAFHCVADCILHPSFSQRTSNPDVSHPLASLSMHSAAHHRWMPPIFLLRTHVTTCCREQARPVASACTFSSAPQCEHPQ